MYGKLLWHKLKVVEVYWHDGQSTIGIHIPIQLNMSYDSFETEGLDGIIHDAIHKELFKRGWPMPRLFPDRMTKVNSFYLPDWYWYHFQMTMQERTAADFYQKMQRGEITPAHRILTDY